jgi:hypothetical protein
MAKLELECVFSCGSDGMHAVLYDGYADEPGGHETVRGIINSIRNPKNQHHEMLREVLGILAGQIAERMQKPYISDMERDLCAEHLREMFR